MSKFRKKPVVIEAVQFVEISRTQRKFGVSVEYNDSEIADFMGRIISVRTTPSDTPDGRTFIPIKTTEGVTEADVGDWVIKDVVGEFYACKPDVFAMTYEPAERPPQQPAKDEAVGLEAEAHALAHFFEGVRVFVTSREKIKHPEGTDLFDEHVTRLLRLATALRRLSAKPEQGDG